MPPSRTNPGSHVEDMALSHRENYDWIVHILRQFKQLIEKTIRAWESFEEREVSYFDMSDLDVTGNWNMSLLDTIRRQVSELKELQKTLEEKKEMFDNMRTRVWHLKHPDYRSNI